MIADCAVDPEVISKWEHFHSLHDDFGVSKGRLICEFPANWRKMVIQRVQQLEAQGVLSPAKASTIIAHFELGHRFRRALVSSGRAFAAASNWVQSAAVADPPFDLIVAEQQVGCASSVPAGEFLKNTPPYDRRTQDEVMREAGPLIKCGWNCYRRAREIVIVDPNFQPVGQKKERFARVLGHLLEQFKEAGIALRRIEVHVEKADQWILDVQQTNWQYWANDHLPERWKLAAKFWEALPDTGGGMHARYILTDFGGLCYDWGLDEAPNERTQVSLLDDSMWSILWQRYRIDRSVSQKEGCWLEVVGRARKS